MIIDITIDGHGRVLEVIHSIYVVNVGPVKDKPHLRMYHCWLDKDPRIGPRPKVEKYVVHKREDGAIYLAGKVLKEFKNKTQPTNDTEG